MKKKKRIRGKPGVKLGSNVSGGEMQNNNPGNGNIVDTRKNIEDLEKQNTELIEVLKKVSCAMKVHIAGVIATILLALFTFVLAKSTADTTIHVDKMARATAEASGKAAEIAHSIGNVARSTADVAQTTAEVALATSEMVQNTKKLINPRITLYCLIKSEFDCETDAGITFEASKYLWRKRQADFYVVVRNQWTANIRGDLKRIGFKVSVLNTDKEVLHSVIYYKTIYLDLGPSEITKIISADDIEQKLAEGFDWRKSMHDKIIRIEIDKSEIKVPNYAYPGIKVKYFELDKFNNLYEAKKNKKQ